MAGWGRPKPKQPKQGARAKACLACGFLTCRCGAITTADGGTRPCPHHPGYLLRGTAKQCSHPDC